MALNMQEPPRIDMHLGLDHPDHPVASDDDPQAQITLIAEVQEAVDLLLDSGHLVELVYRDPRRPDDPLYWTPANASRAGYAIVPRKPRKAFGELEADRGPRGAGR